MKRWRMRRNTGARIRKRIRRDLGEMFTFRKNPGERNPYLHEDSIPMKTAETDDKRDARNSRNNNDNDNNRRRKGNSEKQKRKRKESDNDDNRRRKGKSEKQKRKRKESEKGRGGSSTGSPAKARAGSSSEPPCLCAGWGSGWLAGGAYYINRAVPLCWLISAALLF